MNRIRSSKRPPLRNCSENPKQIGIRGSRKDSKGSKTGVLRRGIGTTLAAMLLLLTLAQAAPQDKPPIGDVVDSIDKLYRANSSYALLEMEIVTPHWQRTLEMKSWSEGKDKTFIRILKPQKEKGMGTLRIGNEMWNYLPKVNKVMRIPPSMMMSSWMGSDFDNNDLVKEYTFFDDYEFEYASVTDPRPGRLYIKCTPKPGRPIVWGYVMLEVEAKSYLPETQKYYDDKGELMRVMNFKDVRTFDNRRIPSVMELIPQNKEGNKTIVRYREAAFDISIPAATFTNRNLRDFRG